MRESHFFFPLIQAPFPHRNAYAGQCVAAQYLTISSEESEHSGLPSHKESTPIHSPLSHWKLVRSHEPRSWSSVFVGHLAVASSDPSEYEWFWNSLFFCSYISVIQNLYTETFKFSITFSVSRYTSAIHATERIFRTCCCYTIFRCFITAISINGYPGNRRKNVSEWDINRFCDSEYYNWYKPTVWYAITGFRWINALTIFTLPLICAALWSIYSISIGNMYGCWNNIETD